MTAMNEYADEALAIIHALAGETVTYTAIGESNSDSSITALAIEQQFAITDDKENKKFVISSDDVASPERGDVVTEADGTAWVVLDIQSRAQGSFFLLSGIRAQDRA